MKWQLKVKGIEITFYTIVYILIDWQALLDLVKEINFYNLSWFKKTKLPMYYSCILINNQSRLQLKVPCFINTYKWVCLLKNFSFCNNKKKPCLKAEQKQWIDKNKFVVLMLCLDHTILSIEIILIKRCQHYHSA